MKEAIKNNKKVIIIGIVIIVLLLLGIAFAYLTTTLHGQEEYVLRAGTLNLELDDKNELTLSSQIPLEDKEGMSLEGFNFSLINNGKIETDYTIYLDDIALDEGENRMPDSSIRYSLTKNEVVGSPDNLSNMGANPNRVVDKGSIAVDETINYTLRIWIDYDATSEEAGGKTFKGKLRVEASQHVIPETTKKILADNELQEEKENMFNYTASGTYIDNYDDWNELTNPEYVTNGLYSMEDEDGVSYYFRGNVNNNNVQFGEYTSDYYVYGSEVVYFQTKESCIAAGGDDELCQQVKLASQGDKMYWKIIRINGDGSLRLIYNGTSANPDNSDLAHSYVVGISPYNLEYNDSKHTGYTYDNGTNSFIKKEVDTWYENTLGSSSYDSKVSSGRYCSDSSGYKTAPEYGILGWNENTYLYASSDRLDQASATTAYAKPNAPTLSCPATEETYGGSYRLKAGLITADELVLAGSLPYMGGENDSYLAIGTNNMLYWSMTPAFFDLGNANVWGEYGSLDNNFVGSSAAVRPVINVTTENGFTSGDGTVENIYVIS